MRAWLLRSWLRFRFWFYGLSQPHSRSNLRMRTGTLPGGAKLKVVVDLAIVDNPIAAVSIGHGLTTACRHIDDGQAPLAEPQPLGLEMHCPNTIRPTVGKTIGEFAKLGCCEASASISPVSDNSAHRLAFFLTRPASMDRILLCQIEKCSINANHSKHFARARHAIAAP